MVLASYFLFIWCFESLRNSFKIKKLEKGPRQDDRRVGKEKDEKEMIGSDKK